MKWFCKFNLNININLIIQMCICIILSVIRQIFIIQAYNHTKSLLKYKGIFFYFLFDHTFNFLTARDLSTLMQ